MTEEHGSAIVEKWRIMAAPRQAAAAPGTVRQVSGAGGPPESRPRRGGAA
jgi:hypothetical protein